VADPTNTSQEARYAAVFATSDLGFIAPSHHSFSHRARDTISARYFFTNFESVLPFGAGGLTASLGGALSRSDLNFPLDLPVHDRFPSASESHVFSPALITVMRLALAMSEVVPVVRTVFAFFLSGSSCFCF
jgi:hypothetical protein